ncbi:hypothetical protein BC941DRAFT_412897 [Chlamydoabsidia padenii]|nr:hypothetical protein BC941DRAFT_412897 [Chlamydoabsidia padenii]
MQDSTSKEGSSNQPYEEPQLGGFNYPFAFNNNLSGIPADFLFGNQIPDDFFQFVTDSLETTSTNLPTSTTPILQPSSSTQKEQQKQQKSDTLIPSPSNPLNPSFITQQQPSIPTTKAPFNTTINKPQQVNTSPNMSLVGRKRKTEATTNGEPANQSVYTVIVGGKTFRLSWESLKSDGPTNFFVNYFRRQSNTRVMYVDRDAGIFEMIVHHLRGYYVRPVDDTQNQDLLNDARYYGLQRLYKTLQEFLFVNVGGRVFRLSWDLLRKDGKNNFFTGPLMHSLFSPHGGREQGAPPYIDRDPDNFADIVNHLRGYTITIRDETHRKNLLKDAQYYVFRQLVEKLMTARKTVDGFGEEGSPEVLLLLQDVRIISILPTKRQLQKQQLQQEQEQNDNNNAATVSPLSDTTSFDQQNWNMTQLQYKREGVAHALLVQVADICIQVHYPQHQTNQHGSILLTMEMCEDNRTKLNFISQAIKASTGVQDKTLYLDDACAITVDDQHIGSLLELKDHHAMEVCTKCVNKPCRMLKLILLRGICGIHLMDNNILTLCAVRLETISSRLQLNMKREFLPAN